MVAFSCNGINVVRDWSRNHLHYCTSWLWRNCKLSQTSARSQEISGLSLTQKNRHFDPQICLVDLPTSINKWSDDNHLGNVMGISQGWSNFLSHLIWWRNPDSDNNLNLGSFLGRRDWRVSCITFLESMLSYLLHLFKCISRSDVNLGNLSVVSCEMNSLLSSGSSWLWKYSIRSV